jgi:hypothetical protein
MHHGSICLSGTGCIAKQGNRNLADFFEITADQNGAAYIVFNNTANDLIQQTPATPVPNGVVDHTGAAVVMVVRQVGGPSLHGGDVNQPTDIGAFSITAPSGDALYPAANGPNYPGLDITGTSMVAKDASTLEATINIADTSQIAAAAQAIGAPFVDFIVRWEYKSKLYFAEAEMAAGAPASATFYDGLTQTIDLCSVSACDPHVLTYPGPGVAPTTSHLISAGTVNPKSIVIDIPRADVGAPPDGDHLDSVGAYSLVSLYSANVGATNAQAQNDQVPVEVDGACCFTPSLAPAANVPEVPFAPSLIVVGMGLLVSGALYSRRRLRTS